MNYEICHGAVVITTAQLQIKKPKLMFCAGSNPAGNVSEVCDDKGLWQWARQEIKLNLLIANPTKWSNLLKQFVGCCRRIF